MAKKLKKTFDFAPLNNRERILKKELLSTPVNQINLQKARTIADLVLNYAGMSVQARNLGACAQVLKNMLADKSRPTVLLGLAGPLIAGGLRKVIRDMIAYDLVDAVVSTGAIIYQDIYQARGFDHFIGSPKADDAKLRDLLIDRIYDTYVDEEKFWDTDCWIGRFADTLEPRNYSSREFLKLLGEKQLKDENSILYTATKKGIPVFCPALNDSSIGIGLTEYYHRKTLAKQPKISIDPIRDNYELAQIVFKSKKTAAIYVAGGVPKNYINDAVVMSYIFGEQTSGHSYAIQMTTDAPHWGGLSGSTLDEGKSWGKISKSAHRAMVFVDPMVSLPLIVGYALQKGLYRGRKHISFEWDGDKLKNLHIK